MRLSFVLVLLLPSVSFAQTEEMIRAVQKKLENDKTAKWVFALEAPNGGFYLAPKDPRTKVDPQPSLRATNGALRALKYLGFPLLKKEREKHAAFVLSCYDPKTGAFAEPGGKPDVTITAIGVMAAAELDIPHEKYAKAMDYLKDNAKTFEEVRIGAAAVEAWGVKDCPFDLKPWLEVADKELGWDTLDKIAGTLKNSKDGGARQFCSVLAFNIRLNQQPPTKDTIAVWSGFAPTLGQRDDGGWGKKGEKASDIETTYRVMRALMLLKEKPKDVKKLREFIASHRNADDGYATKPGEKSSMSGVYYCVIISHWLDEMEAAKK
jgi:prenyltransferase beta subunit